VALTADHGMNSKVTAEGDDFDVFDVFYDFPEGDYFDVFDVFYL